MPLFTLALDVQEEKTFKNIVDQTADFVDFFKVGPVAIFSIGLKALEYISEKNKKIFLDMKFYDIPSVVSRTIEALHNFNVKILTVHASGGEKIVRASVETAKKFGIEVAAVTILTSEKTDVQTVVGLSEKAKVWGADWVVCHSQFAKYVKDITGLKTISPGVRISESKDDHENTFLPSEAKNLGIDMIVVGRPIILSVNPREQAIKIKNMLV